MIKAPPRAEYPVIDGFFDKASYRCNLTFLALASREFEALRRAGGYRQKHWCTPKDSTTPIPARDSYEYQVEMKPGSAIWGYTFTGFNSLNDETDVLQIMSFQVRDACDDVPLLSEFGTQQEFGGNNLSDIYLQQPLAKLMIVGPPGLLTVEIASTYSTAQTGVQLILWGGEPV
jgi:hypothetical protein